MRLSLLVVMVALALAMVAGQSARFWREGAGKLEPGG
jgi:hypothetical protein